jgi:precorrin-4 methylase
VRRSPIFVSELCALNRENHQTGRTLEEILRPLRNEHQRLVVQVLLTAGRTSQSEVQSTMNSLPPEVQEAIAQICILKLEEEQIQKKLDRQKASDAEIRQTAMILLAQMFQKDGMSSSAMHDSEWVNRAVRMAQQLHDLT